MKQLQVTGTLRSLAIAPALNEHAHAAGQLERGKSEREIKTFKLSVRNLFAKKSSFNFDCFASF